MFLKQFPGCGKIAIGRTSRVWVALPGLPVTLVAAMPVELTASTTHFHGSFMDSMASVLTKGKVPGFRRCAYRYERYVLGQYVPSWSAAANCVTSQGCNVKICCLGCVQKLALVVSVISRRSTVSGLRLAARMVTTVGMFQHYSRCATVGVVDRPTIHGYRFPFPARSASPAAANIGPRNPGIRAPPPLR